MANKKKSAAIKEAGSNIPASLVNQPFYGLELDEAQCKFRDAIYSSDNDIIFCDAMAGTGKTTIALGTANIMVKYGIYDRIIYLISPTQEAKIGFLPGGPGEKLAPYFLPLYDAAVTLGLNPFNDINTCTDEWTQPGDGYIDCMSHIFLRGRNIDSRTILIFDEAQNAYLDEVRTILTRVHDGTKCVIIGHRGQCDLYKYPERSGFVPYIEHFRGQERCVICELTENHRGWVSRHADKL